MTTKIVLTLSIVLAIIVFAGVGVLGYYAYSLQTRLTYAEATVTRLERERDEAVQKAVDASKTDWESFDPFPGWDYDVDNPTSTPTVTQFEDAVKAKREEMKELKYEDLLQAYYSDAVISARDTSADAFREYLSTFSR